MQPTDNIGYLFQHLAAVLARQSDQTLRERLGIGFSQFKILMVLRNDPHVQQRFIADSLGQTEASISRQIKLMLQKGMLTSKLDPQNRRVHIATLTTKGLRVTDEATSILNNLHEPTFGRLNEKQRQQLFNSISQLHDAACNSGNHPLIS